MRLSRFLIRMMAMAAIVIVAIIFLHEQILSVFNSTPVLNGAILGVLFVGLGLTVYQLLSLDPEITWLRLILQGKPIKQLRSPRILAPLMPVLHRDAVLTSDSFQTLLESIYARLHESRELMKYLIGLLVFMGLLGTFWGLSLTVSSVSTVINNLPSGDATGLNFLDQLKSGLQAPLSGMGVAFSSSLFGLSSSLILGFFELQTNQARHEFFRKIEDTLSRLIQHGKSAKTNHGDATGVPAYIQALLEQTAENLDSLQRVSSKTEEGQNSLNQNLANLCEKMGDLVDRHDAEKNLIIKITNNLAEFQKSLMIFTDKLNGSEMGLDASTRAHIRHMDETIQRLVELSSIGQATLTKEIRNEIRILTRTMTNLAANEENILELTGTAK